MNGISSKFKICDINNTIKKVKKKQAIEWKKIFANHVLIRDLFPEHIKNSCNAIKR